MHHVDKDFKTVQLVEDFNDNLNHIVSSRGMMLVSPLKNSSKDKLILKKPLDPGISSSLYTAGHE
jgi:hypothetical protein